MKTFTKVTLILLVSLVLVLGSTSLYAQDEVKKDVKKKTACCKADAKQKAACKEHAEKAAGKIEHKTIYVCPVEGCKYKSDKPGKCPKCGKELVKKESCCAVVAKAHEVYYVCPMKQCNYKSDKPGKCPKCGMELKKVVSAHECSEACAKACAHAEKGKTHKEHKEHEHKK